MSINGVQATVRPATLDDSASIGILAEEWGYPVTPAQVEATLNRSTSGLAVAVVSKEVIGWIETRISYSMGGGEQAEITGLVVSPNSRRSGAGRALVAWAGEWAKAQGGTTLVVRSRTTREEAHAFYRSVGFEVVKQQTAFKMILV